MVRREGRWGKLCMQNFESAVERLRPSFQVNDLGHAVCKELTFRLVLVALYIPCFELSDIKSIMNGCSSLEKVERKTDSARANDDQSYYEIIESDADAMNESVSEVDDEGDMLEETPRASTLDYSTSKCSKRQIVHIQCRDLQCGIRPQTVSTRAR